MLDKPFGEEIFPNIQSKPHLAQLEAISSHHITCYLAKGTDTYYFQVAVESNKVSPQPPFLQTTPVPSATPHKTCSPDPSPASLLFFGHTPAPQCCSCSEGPKTEHPSLTITMNTISNTCQTISQVCYTQFS